MSETPLGPPTNPSVSSPTPSRIEHFRNLMIGLAGAITAVVIPVLGIYYTSSDKEREVSKDFVEISTKILSDKPTEDNKPLREWAIAVLDRYSPVPLSFNTKQLLLNNQPIYSSSGSGVSQKTLQTLENSGMILGIFLSHHNITPDFAALKAHQVEFTYIKLTQGNSILDSKANEYASQAKAKGLKVGLYHFFIPDIDSDAQFANFQTALQNIQWDLPPMIDCEDVPNHPLPADYAKRVAHFAEKVEETLHVKPVIYTGAFGASESLDQSVSKYPLFIASFRAEQVSPKLPKWWKGYLFWHLADNVIDDPVLHSYDIIAFKGTPTSLALLATTRN